MANLSAALRQLGQVLAEADARHPRGDLAELAAMTVGGVGLHVEGVHVARPAGKANEDRRLGLCRPDFIRLGDLQILGQAQADTRQPADAEKVAAIQAIAVLMFAHGIAFQFKVQSGRHRDCACYLVNDSQ